MAFKKEGWFLLCQRQLVYIVEDYILILVAQTFFQQGRLADLPGARHKEHLELGCHVFYERLKGPWYIVHKTSFKATVEYNSTLALNGMPVKIAKKILEQVAGKTCGRIKGGRRKTKRPAPGGPGLAFTV